MRRKRVNEIPIYGLYENINREETLVFTGNIDEVVEFTGLKKSTIYHALQPTSLGDFCYHKYRIKYLYNEQRLTKYCSGCCKEKAVTEFYNRKDGTGYRNLCRSCWNKYSYFYKRRKLFIMLYDDYIKAFCKEHNLKDWYMETKNDPDNGRTIYYKFIKKDGSYADGYLTANDLEPLTYHNVFNEIMIKNFLRDIAKRLNLTEEDN